MDQIIETFANLAKSNEDIFAFQEADDFQPDFSAMLFSPSNEGFTIFSMFFWPQANISKAFGPKMAKIQIKNQKWLDFIQTLRVPGGQYRYYISMNLILFIDL